MLEILLEIMHGIKLLVETSLNGRPSSLGIHSTVNRRRADEKTALSCDTLSLTSLCQDKLAVAVHMFRILGEQGMISKVGDR